MKGDTPACSRVYPLLAVADETRAYPSNFPLFVTALTLKKQKTKRNIDFESETEKGYVSISAFYILHITSLKQTVPLTVIRFLISVFYCIFSIFNIYTFVNSSSQLVVGISEWVVAM